MAFRRVGQAGVGDLCHQIAEIAGIADRAFNALVGDDPADHELPDAKISEHVVDMRGDENRGG